MTLLLQTIEDLIRFESTKDRPDQLDACVQYVEAFFQGTGLSCVRETFDGVSSIVVTKHTKTPKVFLSGHLDVVPATPDQFIPRVEGRTLFGRGAMDMKSGVAVMMHLMREFAQTNHDVGLMLTTDEEIGGFHGTGKLLGAGYTCEVVVIPDGGEQVQRVVAKEKGIVRATLKATGERAHGSRTWKGKNAIDLLTDAVVAIRGAFVPLEAHPEDHWVTTWNVGVIQGGLAANQVPDFAEAICDIRYTEADTPEAIGERLRACLPQGVEVLVHALAPLMHVPLEHPHVQAYKRAIAKHGRSVEITLGHGASDGRFFADRGIPVVMSQPDGGNHHGPNEWVNLDAVDLYHNILRSFVDEVASVG